MSDWVFGVSTGIWIMSAIWIASSMRSIRRSERAMSEHEAQITAAFKEASDDREAFLARINIERGKS